MNYLILCIAALIDRSVGVGETFKERLHVSKPVQELTQL